MQADLIGNTNYVALKDLTGALVVPRTNLSAVDMVATSGLKVNGDLLIADLATIDDIAAATPDRLVDPFTLRQAAESNYANTEQIQNGTPNKTLGAPGLKAALSSGKAVDVTSSPSVSAGTLFMPLGYKDQLTWTGTAPASFGF